jgi:hypothetical protein
MRSFASLFEDPMRHEHPHRVRMIRINVEGVRLAKEIG